MLDMGKSTSLSSIDIQPVRTGSSPVYLDLDKLKSADGIVAIISQRLANQMITFAVFKEFERDNRVDRTSFIPASLAKSYLDMVALVMERVNELHNSPAILQQLQATAIAKLAPDEQHLAQRVLRNRSQAR